jgi:gliding motility-associated-like protein
MQVITVSDNEAPVFNCPMGVQSCESVISYSIPVALDNCGSVNVVQIAGLTSGSEFPEGITENIFVATDENGNTDTCSVIIEVYPAMTLETTTVPNSNIDTNDGSASVLVEGGTPEFSYVWSTGSVESEINSLSASTYTVTVTDSHGCTSEAIAIIVDENIELALPTGFSPNGDGNNDFYVIRNIELYPINNLRVFNRWGDFVYESDSYYNQWDGKNSKGENLAEGTYFIILTIPELDATIKNFIVIKR